MAKAKPRPSTLTRHDLSAAREFFKNSEHDPRPWEIKDHGKLATSICRKCGQKLQAAIDDRRMYCGGLNLCPKGRRVRAFERLEASGAAAA